jgi:hypothetical protein
MTFDSRHVLESRFNSEQATALLNVHPKAVLRYARAGLDASLRVVMQC